MRLVWEELPITFEIVVDFSIRVLTNFKKVVILFFEFFIELGLPANLEKEFIYYPGRQFGSFLCFSEFDQFFNELILTLFGIFLSIGKKQSKADGDLCVDR